MRITSYVTASYFYLDETYVTFLYSLIYSTYLSMSLNLCSYILNRHKSCCDINFDDFYVNKIRGIFSCKKFSHNVVFEKVQSTNRVTSCGALLSLISKVLI
jgi:hypothetical protein